jgi:RimJ/RimL family protein N-acetyltransferase
MLAELAERYAVHDAHAVFKRNNVRSRRLLERLGFAPALPEGDVGSDELLMARTLSVGVEVIPSRLATHITYRIAR